MHRATLAAVFWLASAGLAPAQSLNQNSPTGSAGLMLIDKIGRQVRFFDAAGLKEISGIQVGVMSTFKAGAGIETLSYY